MLKVFWDKDNIGFISDKLNSVGHSHCVLQLFLSFGEPMQITVGDRCVGGKCVIVNKNVTHAVNTDGKSCLSVLIEPTSSFASGLIAKINGDYLVCDNGKIGALQQKASELCTANDGELYKSFVQELAACLGVDRNQKVLDERIAELLNILQNCDCYDHTVESFADKVALSSSRLSHLFREQIGVPLKSYILFHQLERAFTALLSGKSITEAAMLAGFDSPSHFAATVKKWMGMPASSSLKDSEILKVFI